MSSGAEDSAGEMPVFDNEKPNRFIRKRRIHSSSFSHSGQNGMTVNGLPSNVDNVTTAMHGIAVSTNRLPYGKNSRKSRNGSRSSTSKKNSTKDVWFRANDEMDEIVLDHGDPDYDSEEEECVVFNDVAPAMEDEAFENMFSNVLREFFDHGKTDEVMISMKEVNITCEQRRRIPMIAISFAMQYKSSQCELTSELLSDMYSKIVSPGQMQQGFHLLLSELPDIIIDVPKAPDNVGRFIARAIADDILPPQFLKFYQQDTSLASCENQNTAEALAKTGDSGNHSPPISAPPINPGKTSFRSNSGGDQPLSSGISSASNSLATSLNGGTNVSLCFNEPAYKAVQNAEKLLQLTDSFKKLDSIWVAQCGRRANKMLSKQIQQIITDYMRNEDIIVVTESLHDMDAPHFHHELVYQCILTGMESGEEICIGQLVGLLRYLCDHVIITSNQLETGLSRVYGEMPLLQKELPCAYAILNRVINKAVEVGLLSEKSIADLPTKGRKRFVSEGDFVQQGHYK